MDLIKEANKKKQACLDSIEHWQLDVVDMFDEGYKIGVHIYNINNQLIRDFCWVKNEVYIKVKIGIDYDSLCLKYERNNCLSCPWYLYSNRECWGNNEEYYNFYKNPTRENALAVIEKLWDIGINK